MDLQNLQPCSIHQHFPFRLRSLFPPDKQHDDIEVVDVQIFSCLVRDDHFPDEEGGLGVHGGGCVLKDLETRFLGVIVEAATEVVDFGPCWFFIVLAWISWTV